MKKKRKVKDQGEARIDQVLWIKQTLGAHPVDYFACLMFLRIGKKTEYAIAILQEIVGSVDDISLRKKAKTTEPYFNS